MSAIPVEAKKKIYGSILASDEIWKEMRKWREFFKITQSDLADAMGISPSVVSDYENGRQKNPGSKFLRKYVESLLRLDRERGSTTITLLSSEEGPETTQAIIDLAEYEDPVPARRVLEATDSEATMNGHLLDIPIFGYTVLDSISAILNLSGDAFYSLYGATTERAIVFTKVSVGRSPLVAIRVYPLKPRMVIIHGPSEIDELAQKIAKRENLILCLSRASKIEDIVDGLKGVRGKQGVP